jgi:hypothetical protein
MLVVVPIKPGSREAVRRLLAGGPPFDPEKLAELDRLDVFVTATEVIFLLESRRGAESLAALLAESAGRPTAEPWRDHVAGPAHVEEEVYSWRPGNALPDPAGLYYLPTPGPGDSEGGDIF